MVGRPKLDQHEGQLKKSSDLVTVKEKYSKVQVFHAFFTGVSNSIPGALAYSSFVNEAAK